MHWLNLSAVLSLDGLSNSIVMYLMLKLIEDRKPTARVILGGGAALGLAEIGVLEVLEESFDITGIIGTSIGSVIGGLYACGYTPRELLRTAVQVNTRSLLSPINIDRSLSGIFDGKKVLRLFEEWTGGIDIEDCRIPFLAVSYDLLGLNTVILDHGSLAKAMRASSSVPYIFAPFKKGRYALVDGGVEYPLPLGLEGNLPGELTIAVNVLPVRIRKPELLQTGTSASKAKKMHINEVFLNSVIQNQAYLAMHSIINHHPDLVIDAWYPEGTVFGFDKAETFYGWGIAKAREALASFEQPNYLKKLLRTYKQLASKLYSGQGL